MKKTGIVRRVDLLGRVTLPKELRSTFDLSEGTPIEIFVSSSGIILHKFAPGCVLCGSCEDTIEADGRCLCHKCADGIAKAVRG